MQRRAEAAEAQAAAASESAERHNQQAASDRAKRKAAKGEVLKLLRALEAANAMAEGDRSEMDVRAPPSTAAVAQPGLTAPRFQLHLIPRLAEIASLLGGVLEAITSALGVSLNATGAGDSGNADGAAARGARSRNASNQSSGVEEALEQVRGDGEGEGAGGDEDGSSTFAMLRRLYHTRQSDEARWARVAKELGDALARARALQGTVERGVAAGAIGSAWGTGFGAGGRGDLGSRLSAWAASLCSPCFPGNEPARARYAQVDGSTPAREVLQRARREA